MPPLEEMDCWETAVLLSLGGTDDYNEPKRGDPVEIYLRWVKRLGQNDTATENTDGYDASVVVTREVTLGSWIYLGPLTDWNSAGSGSAIGVVLEVVKYGETPDLKNRFRRRTLQLKYYRETPPEE